MDLALRTGRAAGRHPRRRRRPHPGGRRRADPVRRDLPPQRRGVRRHPADLAHPRPERGRRGVLPRAHRLHRHGRQDVEHVHHRPGRHPRGHRRGRRLRGARRRADAQRAVRRRALPGRRRGRRDRLRQAAALLPAGEQPHRPADLPPRVEPLPRGHRRRPRPRRARPGLRQPALRHADRRRARAGRRRAARGPAAVRAATCSSGSGTSRATRSASWPTSRCRWPGRWTSTPPRRPPGSCARATRSTSRC